MGLTASEVARCEQRKRERIEEMLKEVARLELHGGNLLGQAAILRQRAKELAEMK